MKALWPASRREPRRAASPELAAACSSSWLGLARRLRRHVQPVVACTWFVPVSSTPCSLVVPSERLQPPLPLDLWRGESRRQPFFCLLHAGVSQSPGSRHPHPPLQDSAVVHEPCSTVDGRVPGCARRRGAACQWSGITNTGGSLRTALEGGRPLPRCFRCRQPLSLTGRSIVVDMKGNRVSQVAASAVENIDGTKRALPSHVRTADRAPKLPAVPHAALTR